MRPVTAVCPQGHERVMRKSGKRHCPTCDRLRGRRSRAAKKAALPPRPQRTDVGGMKEHSILVDPDIAEKLIGRNLYLDRHGYARFSTPERKYLLHQFVMGGTRPGLVIDHINGNPRDNRRANLRFVSYQENQVNRRHRTRNNKSGVRGVSFTGSRSKPWRAAIGVDGRTRYLGIYATQEEAAAARRKAELEFFGEECPTW